VVAEDWSGASSAPRAGDRVPDLLLSPGDPGRLFDLLRGTRHTLLLLEGNEDGDGRRGLEAVGALVRDRWAGQIAPYRVSRDGAEAGTIPLLHDPDGRLHAHFGARLACLYLIRPDGHVGYRARPPDPGRFTAYLGRVLLGPLSAAGASP
jgi:hypothetical protein